MFVLKLTLVAACLACVSCQHNGPTTTPVPILKQINKQNDDGSYSYGYEAADGSFKIETKYPNGDVAGKYGYVDESGKPREISYGASSQRGFEPQGSGIMVPPPTVYDPTSSNALTDGQEDDGQYREDPKIYEDPKYNGRSQGRPASFRQFSQPAQAEPQYHRAVQEPAQPRYQQQQYQPSQTSQFRSGPLFSQQTSLFDQSPQQFPQGQTQQFSQPQQVSQPQQFSQQQVSQPQQFSQQQFSQPQQFSQQQYRPQSQIYHQQPQFSYQANIPQPQYSGQSFPSQNYASQNYQPQNFNPFNGHPAQNFDPNTGSYSINFTG